MSKTIVPAGFVPPKPKNCLRIAHTADNHLRDSHLGVLKRGPDFTQAVMQVIDLAHLNKCDLIANAGDFLNTSRPSPRNIADLGYINARLEDLGMPMYLISGNHDFADPPWACAVLGESLAEAGAHKAKGLIHADHKFIVPRGHTQSICFLPWLSKLNMLEALENVVPVGCILVWHGPVREFCGFPSDANISVDDIKPERYRAVLLGDIHKREYVETHEGTPCLIGYPGATELCARSEPLTHSFEIIDFPEDGSAPQHYQVPIKTRLALAYHIASEDQLDEVLAKVKPLVDQEPMVFIRYDRRISNIKERLHAALDPSKVILRDEPTEEISLTLGIENLLENIDVKQVTDMIPEFFRHPGLLQTTAALLCDPAQNADSLLNQFVSQRLEQCA